MSIVRQARLVILGLLILPVCMNGQSKIAIAVHGGAGNIKNMNLSPEQEQAYTATLSAALDSGYLILQNGGSSLEAAIAAVRILENSPLFNAGYGSVLTHDEKIEMDAAVMEGRGHRCGAVAGVSTVKNPVLAAKAVLEKGQAVLLSGRGAEQFAQKQGVEIVDTAYFFTPLRREQLQKVKNRDTTALDNDSQGSVLPFDEQQEEKYGTVGCVALDQNGNLAAATSTGGIVNKRYNRIGDSPLIGAGTYADNGSCAVSCTGKGEDFIRLVVAYDIAARMRYQHATLRQAAREVILKRLKAAQGRGGCIAIDQRGHIEMPFTTSGMFRGMIDAKGRKKVAIYREERKK